MAFTKTSVGLTRPRAVTPPPLSPEVGDMRGDRVWDGEKWVTEAEWKARRAKEG